MPKEWTFNGIEVTDSMINKVHQYNNKYSLKKTLKPKEKYIFALGTLRPSLAKVCGIIPNVFFANETKKVFNSCNWSRQKQNLSKSKIELGLKLDYCHIDGNATNCTIISCGQISYPKN